MKKLITYILFLCVLLSFSACSDKSPSMPEQLIPGKATVTDVKQWCNDNGFEILTYEDDNIYYPILRTPSHGNTKHPRKTKNNEYAVEAYNGSIKNICFGFTMWESNSYGYWLDSNYSDGFFYSNDDAYYDDTLREIIIRYVFDDESAYMKGYDAISKEVELLNETYDGIMKAVVTSSDESGSNVGKYHQVLKLYMINKELADKKYSDPL